VCGTTAAAAAATATAYARTHERVLYIIFIVVEECVEMEKKNIGFYTFYYFQQRNE